MSINYQKGKRPSTCSDCNGTGIIHPSQCPPGQHMMPDGTCMEGAYHGALQGQKPYNSAGRVGIPSYQQGSQIMIIVECDHPDGGWSGEAENEVHQSNMFADCLNSGGAPGLVI